MAWRLVPIVVLAGLLWLAYTTPALAVLVAWPLLFVVPGWSVLRWTGARLTAIERIGISIPLSVAISANLVYWISLALGGYTRETLFLTLAVVALPVAAIDLTAPVRRYPARAFLARNGLPLLLAALPATLVAVVLGTSSWVVDESGVRTSAVLWSDLLVHLSIAQSVNAGNFPPEVPYFAGVPLTYHWFSDFHAALAARAADLFPIVVFVVAGAILAFSLGCLTYALARRLTGSRRAAAIAIVLATLGGGMGYLRFFGDWYAGGDPVSLLTATSYDNQWLTGWPYFRIASVFGTGLLPHRATTAGLPMLVGCLLLLMASLPPRRAGRPSRDNPRGIVAAGALAAMSGPFHFFFFPAILLLALLYVIAAGRLTDRGDALNAARFLAPMVLAVPFVVTPLLVSIDSGRFALRLWWDAPVADGPLAVAFFYVTNLGVPTLLAVAAVIFSKFPGRTIVALWMLAMFIIPNVAVFNYVTFDMNKYFQVMWIAVAVGAAWIVRRWHPVALAAVLVLSVASPVQVAAYAVVQRHGVLSRGELEAAEWAASNMPPRSVVVTSGWLHSFTDVAGRLRVLSFPPYVANLGHDPAQRERIVQQIFCGGDAARSARLMRGLGASYVAESVPPARCSSPTSFRRGDYDLAFRSGGLRIWRLATDEDGS